MSGWYILLLVLVLYFAGFVSGTTTRPWTRFTLKLPASQLIFTPLYYAYAPNKCDTGFETVLDAFYFSVITMVSVVAP